MTKQNVYKDLGWMNGWEKDPIEYKKCRAAKHELENIHHDWYGLHNEVICHKCKLIWHYDSSG